MAKSPAIKRAFKLLAVCRDPRVRKSIITHSPDALIKTICNAALNVERGEIVLTKKQKEALRKYKSQINKLTSRTIPVAKKRKILNQKGGAFPIIPLILSAALSALGPLLFQSR